jgi:shikimate 5-dehydrogenase
MHKLGLVGQHITKSLTQTFFQELSEIYNIELSYDLFDLFNQNISIEENGYNIRTRSLHTSKIWNKNRR